MSAALLAMVAALAIALAAAAAYRRGRRGNRTTLPPALLAELARHRIDCLGEPCERVETELIALFGERAFLRSR